MLHAAEQSNIPRRTAQGWVNTDPDFAAQLEQAKVQVVETYEQEIHRRGVEGWDEPVYQGGKLVGVVRKYSDVLLIFRTKALAPDRYRDRFHVSADVTHHDGDSKLDAEISSLMDAFELLGEGALPLGAGDSDQRQNGSDSRSNGAAHPAG